MNKFSFEHFSGLPIDYEEFLIDRYKSFITSCRYIEIYFPNDKYHYTIVKENDSIIDIFVYGLTENSCSCYNSLTTIHPDILTLFTESLFNKYPTLNKIKYSASYAEYNLKKSFLSSTANDYILNLPAHMNGYFQAIGTTTRRHLKNYKSKLLRDYPGTQFIKKTTTDIEKTIIDKIVELSYNRMKSKGIIPGKGKKDAIDFYNYSQFYGQVNYIEVDNAVIAGSISYVIDNRFFLYMIAHDNGFSKYNPGQLCILLAIENAIEMGLQTFHFLWGDNDYKIRLGAEKKQISSYVFYRSYSVDFFISKLKAGMSRNLLAIRQSKYTKPLRDAIKNLRKKR